MKKREFNAVLKTVTTKGRLDIAKVALLDYMTKHRITLNIVRNRHAVVTDLIGPLTDRSWLDSMGYSYRYSNAGFNFVGNCEHEIASRSKYCA